jgi:predicted RNase H-like nuclease (RuvC/YqgF family)
MSDTTALKAEITRLHGLVASARNWVSPEEHPAWEEQASAEATSCSREIDCLRAELAAKDKRIEELEETLTAIALDAMESVAPFTEGGEDE